MKSRLVSSVAVVGLLLLGGCSNTPKDDGPRMYHEHVAPIVNNNCVSCHTAGGIGSFELGTYEQAVTVAPVLKEQVTQRIMPPFLVDNHGECQTYKDAAWLTDDEITTVNRWVDEGMLEGNPANNPGNPAAPPTLNEVDLVAQMDQPYTPDDTLTDDYRCFVVDPQIATDKYITGFEAIPGQPQEVHHIVIFTPLDQAASDEADALDAAEAGPGYSCFGGPGVNALVGPVWAPGGGAKYYPDGTGIQILAGLKLVMQVHYNLAAGSTPDKTEMRMDLEDTAEYAAILPFGDYEFQLEPGQKNVTSTASYPIPDFGLTFDIHAVFPHMHTRGKTLRVERTRDGVTDCLVDVPRWDFDWQLTYDYDNVLDVQGGDTISITCTWDTEDATAPITFGEGTADEMCIAGFYVTGIPPGFIGGLLN